MDKPTSNLPPYPGSPEYFRQDAERLQTGLHPLARLAMVLVAVAGTVAYGVHVYKVLSEGGLSWLGPSIAIGAGVSWIVLLVWMMIRLETRDQVRRLADHALITLTIGMVGVLTALALTLSTSVPPLATHLIVLGISDVVMGAYFVGRCSQARLTVVQALLIWVGLMNGVLFAAVGVGYALGGAG